jgi:hypothetical protein
MNSENQFLISILELCVSEDDIFDVEVLWSHIKDKNYMTRGKFSSLLSNMVRNNIIAYDEGKIAVDSRTELAKYIYKTDPSNNKLFKYLEWHDFEVLCREILELNNFLCKTNVRFKSNKKRGRKEIDIIAYRAPNCILAIDCKKWWIRYKVSALRRAAFDQIDRTRIFIEKIIQAGKFPYQLKNQVFVYPLIITSLKEDIKISHIPIVPFFQLNSFLNDFDNLKLQNTYYIEVQI